MNKIIPIILSVVVLSGCSALQTASDFAGDVLSPTPDNVCTLPATPSLPAPNEDGNVILEPDDQAELLIYIEGLEFCLTQ